MVKQLLISARERVFHTREFHARLRKLEQQQEEPSAAAPLGPSYFERHVILHTHIAKSAGTSIVDALTRMLGPASVMDRNRAADPESAVASLDWSRRRALKVLSGHFWYGTQERYFERRPVYIAAVRDPIVRFMSLFNFVLAGEGHPFRREFDRGPNEAARWFFLENPRFANEMANSLGVPEDKSPIDWLESKYAIVAPTHKVDSLIAKLHEFLAPEIEPRRWRSNPAPRSDFIISPAVAEECRASAARDVLLCKQVEAAYDDWLHHLRARLQG
jgi:hypothetical protein